MEGEKLTSCDENKNWLATKAARNLTLLPKQNLAKTTKTLTRTHHNEDWSTKDKGSKNKPPLHWVCARETKKTKPTKLYTELQKGGVNTSSQKLLVSKKATKKKERKRETYKLGGSEFTSVCNQKSLKFHSDDLSKRCWGIEKQKTDTSQTLKMMTIYQTVSQTNYHSHECVSTLPILHYNKEWIKES